MQVNENVDLPMLRNYNYLFVSLVFNMLRKLK